MKQKLVICGVMYIEVIEHEQECFIMNNSTGMTLIMIMHNLKCYSFGKSAVIRYKRLKSVLSMLSDCTLTYNYNTIKFPSLINKIVG